MRRCFVISPIGDEGSPIRDHADYVFYFIIRPALEEYGIEPIRSDHMNMSGRISDQVLREILDDDLCIAVLTGHNPNVFYELAIALSAGRPTILLAQKGEEPPFDVQDLRVVYYDLRPRELFERIYAKQITGHIKNLEEAGWKAQSLLRDLDPLAGFQKYALYIKSPTSMPNLNITNIQWDEHNCFIVSEGVREKVTLVPSMAGPVFEVRFDRRTLDRIRDQPIELQLKDVKGNDWKVRSFYMFQSFQPLTAIADAEKIAKDYGDPA